jgi:hypothetical protein
MVFTYRYDKTSNILRTKASGTVTIAELVEYLRDIVANAGIGPQFVEVVDFEDVVDLQISYSSLHPLGPIWREYINKGCVGTIVCAPADLAYGIARMMQAVVQVSEAGENGEFIVTRSMEDACSAADTILRGT